MTNYEWIVKNQADFVKNILSYKVAKEKGTIKHCSIVNCYDCDFHRNSGGCSRIDVKEWFEDEHEPLYKKGDIVVDSYNQMVLVVEDDCGEDCIMVSRYIDDYQRSQYTIPLTDIKKKVGHIEE